MEFKTAIVTQTKPGWARVRFPELDVDVDEIDLGMESAWLQVLQQWTLGARGFCMPAIGEQVAVLMDDQCESGVILGGVYSSADPVPTCAATARYLDFEDGTKIQYDPEAHRLTADVQGSAEIICTEDLTASTDADATLTAGGKVDVTATGEMTLKASKITLDAPTIAVKGDGLVTGNWYVTGNNSAHHTHVVSGLVALRGEP